MAKLRVTPLRRGGQTGHILLAALVLIMVTSILGLTSLFLAGQDVPGILATEEEAVAQQLTDAAAELIVAWFHDPATTPPAVVQEFARRQGNPSSGPSFFDSARRSQFTGTADHPDLLLEAANPSDNRALNNLPSGFPEGLRAFGQLTRVKVYGPGRPGLLGTLEVTATTIGRRPVMRTVQVQLGALSIPAVRAGLQVEKHLGTIQPASGSPVRVHWGDQRIVGDLVVSKIEDLVVKSVAAPVTDQPYDPTKQQLDRWTDYWIGGELAVVSPPPGQGIHPDLPSNVHIHQVPIPGVWIDGWEYESMKKIALRHGTYYRIDSQGQLHSPEAPDGDPGIAPHEVLVSQSVGDHRGLIFIDTLDGAPPRSDNLGTLVVEADYLEAQLVVQGHVTLKPSGSGRSVAALTPPSEESNAQGSRIPVQLSGIHLNGLLWAAGTITTERSARVFGAIMTGGSVVAGGQGVNIEVWYNSDFGKGQFRGLPIVYRVPGSRRLL